MGDRRLRGVLRTAFTHLPWWKRWLARAGVGFAAVGGVAQVLALGSDTAAAGPGSWSWSALGAGLGCLGGFVVGAALRTFLRLGLVAVGILAAGLFAFAKLGWIELPWNGLAGTGDALGRELAAQTEGLRTFLTGFLPSSTLTGLGLVAGVTQKPEEREGEADAPSPPG